MPYTVRHDSWLGIVEVNYAGSIAAADLKGATSECIALQKRIGATRFMIDLNGCELEASTLDIHDIPEKQYWDADLDRHTRIAVILPASERTREAAFFYEAACRNRGWHAKVLPDRQAAIDWLRGGE